jgi:hypothetical protein
MRGKLNWCFLLLLAYLLGVTLADYHPKISVVKHDEPLTMLLYFDDSSNLMVLRENKLEISYDDGVKFEKIKSIGDSKIVQIQLDPYYRNRGFVFSDSNKHWVTNDKGKTWSSFETNVALGVEYYPEILINVKKPDYLILNINCYRNCVPKNYYSTDGLKSVKELPMNGYCSFAKLNELFEPGNENTLYCTHNEFNEHGHILKSLIYISNDFFKSKSIIDENSFKSVIILGLKIESTFMIAVVQNDRFDENSKTNILISKDGQTFTPTDLKIKSRHGRLSILYHSAQSIFIEVAEVLGMNLNRITSTFYGSDSTGLKMNVLLENIKYSSIFKVQNIEGAWIANVAEEKDDDEGDGFFGTGNTAIKSYYTPDNGKNWELLKINNDDECKISNGCSLHIDSPYIISGDAKLVTGPTPGIIMAAGNKGRKSSKNVNDMSTWISRDGGKSWDKALNVPGQFTFGDQGNVILVVPWGDVYKKPNDKFYFSLDQGKSWSEEKLEVPIWGIAVYTTIDGSSTKFVYNGIRNSVFGTESAFYTVDFSDAFNGKVCKKDDFEEIYARVADDSKPLCLYGYKEKFKRRRQEAKCFVNKLFEDVVSIEDTCECTTNDFECATGFKVSPKGKDVCVPDPKAIASICSQKKVKEINIPDKSIVALNHCEMKKLESDFVTKHKFKCSEFDDYQDVDSPSKEEISMSYTEFEGKLSQYVYTEEHNETALGENIILTTTDNIAYASNNGGASFVRIPTHEKITRIYTGYTSGKVVLITKEDVIYISDDGGDTFHRRKTPGNPSTGRILSFHKTDKEKFIWYTCESSDCQYSTAYYTLDNGENFKKLHDNVLTCDFIGPHLEVELDENKDLIYCSTIESNRKILLRSAKNVDSDFVQVFDNIKGYAITGKFVVIATVDEQANALKASITVDGLTFADADFPSDLNIKSHQAYTILDSATHAIFIHITSDNNDQRERGVLLKSNFNGTSYVLSVDDVNRDKRGYVDFDRIQLIEGTIIVNRAFVEGDGPKKLKTQISHNDGGEWSFLVPPRLDANGKEFECSGKSLQECSLNLHGYTERADYRDMFSSSAAVGVMFGIGNVGEGLTEKSKSSTFLTRDGGVTWKTIKEGEYMWEFGDRGTILVLVNAKEDTDTLFYSLDDGENWIEYKFSTEKVSVLDLATSPSDTSTKFVIFVNSPNYKHSTRAIGIDFADVYKRQCRLDLDNPDSDDYEFWSPSHPLSADDCLFGHEAMYLRRAVGHNDCFIGSAPLEDGFKVTRNCTCSRRDYECDYNYYRDNDNTCKLVKGLTPEDRMKDMCSKNNAFEYFKPTGYRKITLSTCVGGKEYDSWDAEPCPGKEKEFDEHYGRGINKTNIWLVFGVPLFVLVFATWFVYDRGIRRNGGFKRFGQIRLDGDETFQPVEENLVDVVINKIVKGGIVLVAGAYAGIQVVLKLDKMLLQKITSLVFRNSPGRRNYVSVPHLDEEDELFGDFQDNYEEELNEASNGFNPEFEDYDDDAQDILDDNLAVDTNSRLFNIDDDDDSQKIENNG